MFSRITFSIESDTNEKVFSVKGEGTPSELLSAMLDELPDYRHTIIGLKEETFPTIHYLPGEDTDWKECTIFGEVGTWNVAINGFIVKYSLSAEIWRD